MSAATAVRASNLPARVQRRLRAIGTRTRYRLGLPLPGPGDVQRHQRFRHPVDAGERAALVAAYADLFPHAVASEIEEARRLAAHQFTMLGHRMNHGPRIEWSRDPVSGKDWAPGFSPDIPYRSEARLGDIKLPWELNKHQYFFTLGKAGWLTGDGGFAGEIIRQIDDWIAANPYQSGINWITALEAGMRAISWILAYPFYAGHADPRFEQRLVRSLAQHLLFVEQHLSTDAFANTHLVGEAVTLVAGGLFLDSRHSGRWLERGQQILEEEIVRQSTADGLHAERSVAYHRFFLDNYVLAAALLGANGRRFSSGTAARMQAMTDTLMQLLFADGTAPAFGDGDDARAIWCRADAPSDYRGLLALGAVLFGRGDFKAAANGRAEEVLWLFGEAGLRRFEALQPKTPSTTSGAYPDAGYYVMRAGWTPEAATLVLDAGPLGFGPAAHGHADALSVQLHASGYAFLVDPGTYSYNLDYGWRDAFRGTRAHNTIAIDGEEQSVPADRMSWKTAAAAAASRWISTPWFDAVQGQHDGYRRLGDPVEHRRVVLFMKPDVWIICDQLEGTVQHDAELLFHVRPDCTVDVQAETGAFVLTSPAGARLHGRITGCSQVGILSGSDRERVPWFSPQYGVRLPSRALAASTPFAGRHTLVTTLSLSAAVRPEVTVTREEIVVAVRRGGGLTDTLRYRMQREPGRIDGGRFDGDVLFDRISEADRLVYASGFRELVLDDVLDVRAPATIDSLALQNGQCRVTLPAESAEELRVTARGRVALLVNERPR